MLCSVHTAPYWWVCALWCVWSPSFSFQYMLILLSAYARALRLREFEQFLFEDCELSLAEECHWDLFLFVVFFGRCVYGAVSTRLGRAILISRMIASDRLTFFVRPVKIVITRVIKFDHALLVWWVAHAVFRIVIIPVFQSFLRGSLLDVTVLIGPFIYQFVLYWVVCLILLSLINLAVVVRICTVSLVVNL